MRILYSFLFTMVAMMVYSQDVNVLFKEADNFEKQQKENDALEKYKQILILNPASMKALVKAAEMNVIVSNGIVDKKTKRLYIESSLAFAKRAYVVDSTHADANYAMAMASGKMTDYEAENKKIVELVKDIKKYSEKGISMNPNHAKSHYTLGKWHYEMTILSGIKKVAVKLLYGGLPGGDLDSAIFHMEKCKSLEPYFVNNYLDLAKAYKENRQPSKALDVLNRMVKLPTRTSDDIALKAEGVKLLESMQ